MKMVKIAFIRRRIERSIVKKEEENYYYMAMDTQRMLDAGPRGNIARFMNHCCDPNAETQKWNVNGDTRVGLFALGDIKAHTELTFNYQFEAMGEVKKSCLCGAKNCSGFIGEKSKKLVKPTSNGHHLKKKNKLKAVVKKVNKVWEDLCFR
jgi:histone-lysine N-methyltransferase NSD1